MDFDMEEYDLEIIGDPIQYVEQVELPESTRFFTLDDQIQDYVNKRMPRHDISEHALRRLQREADRIRIAYKTYIQLLDSNYSLKGERRRKPTWIHPFIENPTYNTYDFTKWQTLFDKSKNTLPNYYTDVLKSLPKPYEPGEVTEESRVMTENIVGFTDERIRKLTTEDSKFLPSGEYRGLVDYVLTATSKNDDGTFAVIDKSVPNTGDLLRIKGYLKDDLPIDLPRAIPGVPFLDSSKAGIIPTLDELDRIYPSADMIVSHAVKKTDNPYTDALPYLKVWDVKLSEVPWSVWKVQFPQTHRLGESPPVKSINFPKYQLPKVGVQPFFNLLMNMRVKSLAVSPINPSEIQLPDSSPDQCLRTDTYEHFLASGIYREIKDKDGVVHNKCVPVEIIQKEISERYTKGKRPWNDLVKNDILKAARETSELLEDIKTEIVSQPEFENIPIRDSETRKKVLLILKDEERTDKDKASELMNKILANIPPESDTRKIYLDSEGTFLLCAHSLAILNGDYKENPQEFQREWATVIDGKYTCNHCGEKIGNNFVAVTEYDEDGHVVNQASALSKPKGRVVTLKTDIQSLPELQSIFVQIFPRSSAVVQLLFIILTTLQIIPSEDQLREVLEVTAKIQIALKGKISDASLAIAAGALIVQSNSLSARRAYKSKPVNLNGYPRDTDDINDSPIITNFLDILKDVGKVAGIQSHVKAALNTIKTATKIKAEVVPAVKSLLKNLKELESRIKEGRGIQAIEGIQATIVFPTEVVTKTLYEPSELTEKPSVKSTCDVVRPGLVLKAHKGVVLTASQTRLRKIEVPETSKILPTTLAERPRLAIRTESEIRRLVDRFKCPVSFENSIINRFIRDQTDYIKLTNLLTTLIENTSDDSRKLGKEITEDLRISTIQKSFESTYVRTLFYKFFKTIEDARKTNVLLPQLEQTFKKDIISTVLRKDPISALADEESLRAVERLNLVQRLRGMEDEQREVMGRLLQLGLEPGIITNEDRKRFAEQAVSRQADGERYNRHRGEIFGGDDEANIDNEDGLADLPDAGRYGGYGEMQRAEGEETDLANRNGMLAGGEF